MKTKAAIIILLILAVGLAVGLYREHKAGQIAQADAEANISHLSNEWTQTSAKLASQVEVSTTLTNALTAKTEELEKTAKQLTETTATLTKAQTDAQAAAKAAADEIARRDAKIAELEAQNATLDKQATDLRTAIADREAQIAETQRKLAASEGNREFLLAELKRLQAEKADLERKFNDLVVLRDQVHKLREELAISRRLDWIKRGLYGTPTKGATLLQRGIAAVPPSTNSYNLNVEIKRDGGATVTSPTNAPASTNK